MIIMELPFDFDENKTVLPSFWKAFIKWKFFYKAAMTKIETYFLLIDIAVTREDSSEKFKIL